MTVQLINAFLEELFPGVDFDMSSGWRPQQINIKVDGAAKNSLHMLAKAGDLHDREQFLKKNLLPLTNPAHAELLRKYSLFMEHPDYTPTWCHLDWGLRVDRPS